MDRLRIALVGAGRRGASAHLPVIDALADMYELVAICDKDAATANRYAAERSVRAYTSVRDMLDREQIDIADVVVPGDAHHAIAIFLMQRGVHVLVETPIAPTLHLADLMIEGAMRNRVKLEVAENYYRAPLQRLIARVIDAGLIGDVSRIYRVFYEGGYHGMSNMRLHARGRPVSILGVSHTTPVIPIIDRMERHHSDDQWFMGVIDFDNGVMAVQVYSNVIHARALGRGQAGIDQIDGTRGAVVNGDIHLVAPEDLDRGALSKPIHPERVTRDSGGVDVVECLHLPGTDVVWESPFSRYRLAERQIAVADELFSIANAVRDNVEPEYGAARARLDQEMNLAMLESGRLDRQTIHFPLTTPTQHEQEVHANFKRKYGCEVEDVEGLLDVFFPRI